MDNDSLYTIPRSRKGDYNYVDTPGYNYVDTPDDNNDDDMPGLAPINEVSEELKITVVSRVPDEEVMVDAPFINIFAKIEKDGFIYLFSGIGTYITKLQSSNFDEIFNRYNEHTTEIFTNVDRNKLISEITENIKKKNSNLKFNHILWESAELHGTAYNFYKYKFLLYSIWHSTMILHTISNTEKLIARLKIIFPKEEIKIDYPKEETKSSYDIFLISTIEGYAKEMEKNLADINELIKISSELSDNISGGGVGRSLLTLLTLGIVGLAAATSTTGESSQPAVLAPTQPALLAPKHVNAKIKQGYLARLVGITSPDIVQVEANFNVVKQNLNQIINVEIMPSKGFILAEQGYISNLPSLEQVINKLIAKYPSLQTKDTHTVEGILQNMITSLVKGVEIESEIGGIKMIPSEMLRLTTPETVELITEINRAYDLLISEKKTQINNSKYNAKYIVKAADLVGDFEKFINEWNFDTDNTSTPNSWQALSKNDRDAFLNDYNEYSKMQVKKTYFNTIIKPLIEQSRNQIIHLSNDIDDLESKLQNQVKFIEAKIKDYQKLTPTNLENKDMPEYIKKVRDQRNEYLADEIEHIKKIGQLNQAKLEIQMSIVVNYILSMDKLLTTMMLAILLLGLKSVGFAGVGYIALNAAPVAITTTSKNINAGLPFIIDLLGRGTAESVQQLSTLSYTQFTEVKRMLEEIYRVPKAQITAMVEARLAAIENINKKTTTTTTTIDTSAINTLKQEIAALRKIIEEKEQKNDAVTKETTKFLKNAILIHELAQKNAQKKIASAWRNYKAREAKENQESNSTWHTVPGTAVPKGGQRTRNVNKYLKNKRCAKTKRINNHNKTKNLKKKTKNLKKKMRYMTKKI